MHYIRATAAPIGLALSLVAASQVSGQDTSSPPVLSFSGGLTGFSQSVVSGDGDDSVEFGGLLRASAQFNGEAAGLWSGFFINATVTHGFGDTVNTQGDGSIVPLNTALALPGIDDTELSLTFTQVFSPDISLTLGKFDMLQLASATPLIGGGGETTFWNLGLAAPISGVTPPYILGGLLSIKTNPVDYSILVYDPRNAKDSDILSDPFSDGVTLSVSATVPYSFNAFPGYQGLRVVYSSQDGFDLENLPQLQLPPESRDVLNRKDSFYYIAYSFQQYLASFGDGKGWGVFGQLALSDGNPNPVNSSVFLGLGGNSFISGRQDDRWGAAFVLYNFSDDLKDGLDALGSGIRDEYGVEAFYDFQISGNFSIGGDLQVIRPGTPSTDTAIVAGIRARMSF